MSNHIYVKYNEGMPELKKFSLGDWVDLYTEEEVVLKKGDFKIVSLGVVIMLPDGYEALLVPRSSTFKNFGVIQTNSIGIIDESYSGEGDIWGLPVYATRDVVIPKHSRICQFRIIQHQPTLNFIKTDLVSCKSRGGFGSTGV